MKKIIEIEYIKGNTSCDNCPINNQELCNAISSSEYLNCNKYKIINITIKTES